MATGGERLPRAARIRHGREIRSLVRQGRRWRSPRLEVHYAPSRADHPRFGLVVPKHRRKIVERNRLKRRLRELGRRELLPRLRREGLRLDVLVRARPQAYHAPFRELSEDIVQATEYLCSREW